MRLLTAVKDHLSAPIIVGLAGLALFWVMARLDGAQSARLQELDRQQATVTAHALHVAQARREAAKASDAANREIAALRATAARQQALSTHWRRVADSLAGTVQPMLAALPDSVRVPVMALLAVKDSTIATQEGVITSLSTIVDSLTADRDRWRAQDALDANLASQWEAQAHRWEKESKRGCLPLIGCVSQTVTFLVGAGVGGAAVVALRP